MRNRINLLKGAAVLTPLAALAILATGCGGGGGGTPIGGGSSGGGGGLTETAALSGLVSFPGATVAAAGRSNDFVPAPNATVKLISLANNIQVASDTTDANGRYEFTSGLTNFTDYKLEAELVSGGKTYKIRAIVTTGNVSTTQETQNIDPVTTGAADVIISQYEAAKTVDPSIEIPNLEDLFEDIDDETRENYIAPDLSDDDAAEQKKNELKTVVAPQGNYYGTFTGAKTGRLSAIIQDGKFMVFFADDAEYANIQSLLSTQSEEVVAPESTSPISFGVVNDTGVLYATTNDARFTVSGIIIGKVGKGVWRDGDGTSGTWTMNLAQPSTFTGLYSGVLGPEAPEDGGYFAAVVGPDGTLAFNAMTADSSFLYTGVGTVASNGTVTMRWLEATGTTGSGIGNISNGTFTGTLPGLEEETLSFSLSRAFNLEWIE